MFHPKPTNTLLNYFLSGTFTLCLLFIGNLAAAQSVNTKNGNFYVSYRDMHLEHFAINRTYNSLNNEVATFCVNN